MDNYKFAPDVQKVIVELSSAGNMAKRLTLTAWNGGAPKLDLRNWRLDANGDKPQKGVTLSDEEAETLLEALQNYFDAEGA